MTTLANRLVSHWSLEETSGNRADDHGTNTLTSNNSVGRATGKVGFGAQFDAASSRFLSRASNSSLQFTGRKTIGAWVKLPSIPSNLTGYTIVGKDVDTSGSSRDYQLEYFRDNSNPTVAGYRFYINGNVGIVASGTSGFNSTGVWNLVVGMYDPIGGNNFLSMNGRTPVFSSLGGNTAQASSAEFRIGARAYSGFQGYADAIIDQVFIFDDLLNDSELAFIYNQGAGRSYAEIIAAPEMPLLNLNLSLVRYSGNPIINHTGGGAWYASQIYDFGRLDDPNDATKFDMFVTGMAAPTETGIQSIGLFHGNVSNPEVLTEHGGVGNGQILQGSGIPGSFDETSVRIGGKPVYDPDSGLYYLYYTGYDGGSQNIGLATSPTAEGPYTRYSGNPILTPSGQGRDDGANIEEFCVIKEGSVWTGIYCVFTGATIHLAPAISSDGKNWTKVGAASILGPRPDTTTSFPQYHQLIKKDDLVPGLYALVYEDGGILDADTNVYKIRVATSPQAIGPYTPVQSPEPLLAGSGVPGSFDQIHVATPDLEDFSGSKFLYFCGTAAPGAFEGNWSAGIAIPSIQLAGCSVHAAASSVVSQPRSATSPIHASAALIASQPRLATGAAHASATLIATPPSSDHVDYDTRLVVDLES
jgi:hypothetical protein